MWGERRFRFTKDLLILILIYTQVMATGQLHRWKCLQFIYSCVCTGNDYCITWQVTSRIYVYITSSYYVAVFCIDAWFYVPDARIFRIRARLHYDAMSFSPGFRCFYKLPKCRLLANSKCASMKKLYEAAGA